MVHIDHESTGHTGQNEVSFVLVSSNHLSSTSAISEFQKYLLGEYELVVAIITLIAHLFIPFTSICSSSPIGCPISWSYDRRCSRDAGSTHSLYFVALNACSILMVLVRTFSLLLAIQVILRKSLFCRRGNECHSHGQGGCTQQDNFHNETCSQNRNILIIFVLPASRDTCRRCCVVVVTDL